MLPIIYIILMLLRFGLTAMFRPLFLLIKGDINMKEMVFVTVAGLRGSASLIMGSAVVTQQFAKVAGTPETFSVRTAQLGRRLSAFVAGESLTDLMQQPSSISAVSVEGM